MSSTMNSGHLPSETWVCWSPDFCCLIPLELNPVIPMFSTLFEEQCPVDISKTGITLINNLVGMLPVGLAAYAKGETWCQLTMAMGFQGGTQQNRWGDQIFFFGGGR